MNDLRKKQRDLLYLAWHIEAFARQKKLPKLPKLNRLLKTDKVEKILSEEEII